MNAVGTEWVTPGFPRMAIMMTASKYHFSSESNASHIRILILKGTAYVKNSQLKMYKDNSLPPLILYTFSSHLVLLCKSSCVVTVRLSELLNHCMAIDQMIPRETLLPKLQPPLLYLSQSSG